MAKPSRSRAMVPHVLKSLMSSGVNANVDGAPRPVATGTQTGGNPPARGGPGRRLSNTNASAGFGHDPETAYDSPKPGTSTTPQGGAENELAMIQQFIQNHGRQAVGNQDDVDIPNFSDKPRQPERFGRGRNM